MGARFFNPREGTCYPQDCPSYWCFCGEPGWSYSGGDEGLSTSVSFATGGSTNVRAAIYYDAYTVQYDQFILRGDSGVLWNTACVLGSATASVTIPAGNTFLEFEVNANCNAGPPGSLWDFFVTVSCA
jgi:hypothetical protein